MDKKLKSLSLTTVKTVNDEGERQVTFIASDDSLDRDGQRVEIATFRLPLRGGGEMTVAQIPAGGTEDVDIPLLADHDHWDVSKVLGSVRKAIFEDGKLIFEAGISNREYAQDVFKLIDEGHLDNAFSIGIADATYDYDTKVLSDGEIFEVSLVTRGSNRDARVLSVKSMKEKTMDENSKDSAKIVVKATTEEAKQIAAAADEGTVAEKDAEPNPGKDEVEKPVEETTTEENKENQTMDAEITKSIARPAVKVEADQAATAKILPNGYLKTKQAMSDFAKLIANNRGSAARVKALWGEHLITKGITGTYSLPMELETMFFHTWDDVEADVLSTFRRSRRRSGTAIAVTGEGEGIRAKGHRKGDRKADQELVLVQRDLKGILAYKKLPIDYIDLLEDEDGELLRFRTEELYSRLRTEVYTAAILTDGRTAPAEGQPDYRLFNGTRGLYPMVTDLDNSVSAGTGDNITFAKKVATVVPNDAEDSIYAKCVKTLAAVKPAPVTEGSDRRKVLVISSADLTSLALATDGTGRLQFAPGTNFEDVFRAKIVELDGVADSGYDVIAYADQGYTLLGTDEMVRTDFDIEYNRDVMLVEKLVAGSAEGYKTIAGYASAA